MKAVYIGIAIIIMLSFVGLAAEADLEYVDSILGLTGLFIPQGIQLTAPPADVPLPGDAAGEPSYGVIPLNGQGFPILIYRDGDTVHMYVRPASKSDFSLVPWKKIYDSGQHIADFSVDVSYMTGIEPYELIAVWDPAYPTVLVYFRGCYREGMIDLGGEKYKIAVIDENTDGRYDDLSKGTLFIDIDRNGKLLTSRDSHERYTLSEPFNIDGTVYAVKSVSADGAHIVIGKSDTYVPEKVPLEVGSQAPDFSGSTVSGHKISLSGFKGKIVVIDFWASWCHPCVAELPNVRALASEYEGKGLVVIGINLDRSEQAFEKAVDEYGLDYPQIYDGPNGEIARIYRVSAIPMTYLIDRDGNIAGKNLRGEALRRAVERILNPGE